MLLSVMSQMMGEENRCTDNATVIIHHVTQHPAGPGGDQSLPPASHPLLPSLAFSRTVLATMFSSSIDRLCVQGSNAAASEAAGREGREKGREGAGKEEGRERQRDHTQHAGSCHRTTRERVT